MTTATIAQRLVELCRRADYTGAHRELFSPAVVSIEPDDKPGAHATGFEGLASKSKWFEETFESHGIEVSDPIVAGDFFACTMKIDVTDRKSGARFTMQEICLYEVRDGKIVREQFFYPSKC